MATLSRFFLPGLTVFLLWAGAAFASQSGLEHTNQSRVCTGASVDHGRGHNWGGIDPNYYRTSAYGGRARPTEASGTGPVLEIEPGTPVNKINRTIKRAPMGAVVVLRAGRHRLDQSILIERGDITLRGEGEGLTVLEPRFSGAVDHVITISPTWDGYKKPWATIEDQDAEAVTRLTKASGKGATTIQVASTRGIRPGLFVEVSQDYDQYVTEHDDYIGAMAEIIAVNSRTKEVHLTHKIGFDARRGATVRAVRLMNNVTVSDFTIDYGQPEQSVAVHRHFNNNPRFTDFTGSWGTRAVFVSFTHEANLANITVRNAGSNGFLFATNLETYARDLTIDGVQNLGGGGNGYGMDIQRTYYSTFEHLTIAGPVRHAVVFNRNGSSGFNLVHIQCTTANVDFHGGPDYANIYYVERMVLSQKDDYVFPAVEFRDPNNDEENMAVFDSVTTAREGSIPGYTPRNLTGRDKDYETNGNGASARDVIHLGHNGGEVFTFGDADVIFSGRGDDVIHTGSHRSRKDSIPSGDEIYFFAENGRDRIMDFTPGADRIYLEMGANGNGYVTGADVIAAVSAGANGDALIPLGAGNTVTLAGVAPRQLRASDIILFASPRSIPGALPPGRVR